MHAMPLRYESCVHIMRYVQLALANPDSNTYSINLSSGFRQILWKRCKANLTPMTADMLTGGSLQKAPKKILKKY